jgi:hypothetical protein
LLLYVESLRLQLISPFSGAIWLDLVGFGAIRWFGPPTGEPETRHFCKKQLPIDFSPVRGGIFYVAGAIPGFSRKKILLSANSRNYPQFASLDPL